MKGNKLVPDSEVSGDILIYIEFFDTRESQGPSNFQHTSHVGWTQDGGFDVNNIPPGMSRFVLLLVFLKSYCLEWKKIFQSVGIKKRDLVNNPGLANDVFRIMNEAVRTHN